VTTPDDDPTAPVDLPFADAPAPGTRAAPDVPAPPPPPAPHGVAPARPTPVPAPAASPSPPSPASGFTPALVFGVLLVGVGALLLVTRLTDVTLGGDAWPLWLVVAGAACLVASFALPQRQGLGLAIAGAIVTTVGLILWAQETNDAYATWAYAWALVAPTAPGVGTVLYGAVRGDGELVRNGLRSTAVGLALFGGFALFFEGVLGLSGQPIAAIGDVLPFAVVGLGLLLVVVSVAGGNGGKAAR
jgi:hypothetical protein